MTDFWINPFKTMKWLLSGKELKEHGMVSHTPWKNGSPKHKMQMSTKRHGPSPRVMHDCCNLLSRTDKTHPLTRLLQCWHLGHLAHKPISLWTCCLSRIAKCPLIKCVGQFTQQLVRESEGKRSCFFTLLQLFQLLLSSMVYKNNRAGYMRYCIFRGPGWRWVRFDYCQDYFSIGWEPKSLNLIKRRIFRSYALSW